MMAAKRGPGFHLPAPGQGQCKSESGHAYENTLIYPVSSLSWDDDDRAI